MKAALPPSAGRGPTDDSGREAADGAPRRAQRTARYRHDPNFFDQLMGGLALAGASTVGLAADRTRPESTIRFR